MDLYKYCGDPGNLRLKKLRTSDGRMENCRIITRNEGREEGSMGRIHTFMARLMTRSPKTLSCAKSMFVQFLLLCLPLKQESLQNIMMKLRKHKSSM